MHYYHYYGGRPTYKGFGIFKTLFIFAGGIYGGIYIAQNYDITKVDRPSKLFEQLKNWIKQYEKQPIANNNNSNNNDDSTSAKWKQ